MKPIETRNLNAHPAPRGAIFIADPDKRQLMDALVSINDRTDHEARLFRYNLDYLLLFGTVDHVRFNPDDHLITFSGHTNCFELSGVCHYE